MKNEKLKLTTDKKPENTKISYSNSRASCCLRLNKRTRQIQISTNLRFIVYFVRSKCVSYVLAITYKLNFLKIGRLKFNKSNMH